MHGIFLTTETFVFFMLSLFCISTVHLKNYHIKAAKCMYKHTDIYIYIHARFKGEFHSFFLATVSSTLGRRTPAFVALSLLEDDDTLDLRVEREAPLSWTFSSSLNVTS